MIQSKGITVVTHCTLRQSVTGYKLDMKEGVDVVVGWGWLREGKGCPNVCHSEVIGHSTPSTPSLVPGDGTR